MKNRSALTSEKQTWISRRTLRLLQYSSWTGPCASMIAEALWNCKVVQEGFGKQCELFEVSRNNIGLR